MSNVADVARFLRPKQVVTNLRIKPVPADDQISFRLVTVLKEKANGGARVIDVRQLFPESYRAMPQVPISAPNANRRGGH